MAESSSRTTVVERVVISSYIETPAFLPTLERTLSRWRRRVVIIVIQMKVATRIMTGSRHLGRHSHQNMRRQQEQKYSSLLPSRDTDSRWHCRRTILRTIRSEAKDTKEAGWHRYQRRRQDVPYSGGPPARKRSHQTKEEKKQAIEDQLSGDYIGRDTCNHHDCYGTNDK